MEDVYYTTNLKVKKTNVYQRLQRKQQNMQCKNRLFLDLKTATDNDV